ncbi:NADP-dependent oxidoreductase [Rhodovibrionaceae bacterium A322]
MAQTAKEIHLKRFPTGTPTRDDFDFVSRDLPALEDGQALVENLWMSVDPYMRGRMSDRKSYTAGFTVGEVMEGGAVGIIRDSRSDALPVGKLVLSMFGWRSHFVGTADQMQVLPDSDVPEQAYLGVLGMPGTTAYVGLERITELKEGETLFVSAASGAVGTVACQLAKAKGCRVVGSTGSAEKVAYLKDLGVDAVINYKEVDDLTKALAEAAPEGIDVYYENVGGDHMRAALNNMNPFGRIALCGIISNYNATKAEPWPENMGLILIRKLKLQGFIITDYPDAFPEYAAFASKMIADGKLTWRETVYEGLDQAPDAFFGLFEGKNLGKMLVKLAEK